MVQVPPRTRSGGSRLLADRRPAAARLDRRFFRGRPPEAHWSLDVLAARELVWVLDGQLALTVAGERVLVGTGAAAVFLADRPHRYANEGPADLRFAMAVSQPPVEDS